MRKPKYLYVVLDNRGNPACEGYTFTHRDDARGYCKMERQFDPKGAPHRIMRVRMDALEEVK